MASEGHTASLHLQLLDGLPDAIVVVDEQGLIVMANRQVEELLGYRGVELLGRSVEMLIPEPLRARHVSHRAAFAAAPAVRAMGAGRVLTALHRDGTPVAVEISLGPIRTPNGDLTAAAIRDAREREELERQRRRAAEELRRAREAADAANLAKSEFLASMSHELRTPLNAVIGFAQLLQRDRKEPLSERQQERLRHVRRGGEHLLKLIDEVLDLSRIEAGRLMISSEPVDLVDVLGEVRSSLEPTAGRAGITLSIEARPVMPVRADRTRLAQILMNFGSNAIKYGRRGGRVVFKMRQVGDLIRMSVVDDGIGVPESHRDKIFLPFERAGQEAGSIEGTGIGLTISKRLAELMNGKVGLESVEGEGSEFWVEVPLSTLAPGAPTAAELSSVAASSLGTGPDRSRRLVVYVEDNPSNVAFMVDLFAELPHLELATASNAERGIEIIRERKPAAVLMDINLPGMSGIEATRQLALMPETAGIPVVALTAAAMPRDTARAESAGFAHYLTKPVMVEELIRALEDVLA